MSNETKDQFKNQRDKLRDANSVALSLSSGPIAVVGLGNPGKEYGRTRHNVGFSLIEQMAHSAGLSFQEKLSCRFAKAKVNGVDLYFVMPLRYMNLSGETFKPWQLYYRVPTERVIVAYDDLDLNPGDVRFRFGGSSGGHKGLDDLIRVLGGDKFYRVRIGIGHPRNVSLSDGSKEGEKKQAVSGSCENMQPVVDWVLSRPRPRDQELIDTALDLADEGIKLLISDGLEEVQRRFHRTNKVTDRESK